MPTWPTFPRSSLWAPSHVWNQGQCPQLGQELMGCLEYVLPLPLSLFPTLGSLSSFCSPLGEETIVPRVPKEYVHQKQSPNWTLTETKMRFREDSGAH